MQGQQGYDQQQYGMQGYGQNFGQQYGMQTLDQNLQDLVKRGLVTRQQAMGYARNKDIFKG